MAGDGIAVAAQLGRVSAPVAFPPPGTYGVSHMVTLLSATQGATIHYTTNGSAPTGASPVFDAFKLPVVAAVDDGDRGVTQQYTIRAIALRDGMAPSGEARFDYTIARRDRADYFAVEVHPGVHQIWDFDETKMMLVVGSERALLIDAGLGRGDLRGFVEQRSGGKPLDVVITHGHPDHIAALAQFQGNYAKTFLNHRDRPMVEHFNQTMQLGIDLDRFDQLSEGMSFDLGDRRLDVYEVPGHSPGHIVLFDEKNGILFASDAVGSNRATITDSLWMQFPGMSPIDHYLSSLRIFRAKVRGKINEIYGGHNDAVARGEGYLDNLELAAQLLVDHGEAVLTPSLRPTTAWQVVWGDRLTNPDWAAINVSKETCLSAPPDRIASLCTLALDGATLTEPFALSRHDYVATATGGKITVTPTATSGRHRAITINGAAARSGEPATVLLQPGDTRIAIVVTAPDGTTTETYAILVRRS